MTRGRTWKMIAALLGTVAAVSIGGLMNIGKPINGPYSHLKPEEKLARFLKGDGIVLNIAHAGIAHFAPHDTISAIKRAYDMGCDGVEMDVVTCKTGEVIVHHDFTFENSVGIKDRVIDKPLKEIQKLKLKSRNPLHLLSKKRIPTLEEVLARFGGKMILFIEVKDEGGNTFGTEEKVAELIIKHNLASTTMISSFELKSMSAFSQRYPMLNVVEELYVLPEEYRSWYPEPSYPFTISLRHDFVSDEFIKWARPKFRGISTFTPNKIKDIERVVKVGATLVQTDQPRRLANILNRENTAEPAK